VDDLCRAWNGDIRAIKGLWNVLPVDMQWIHEYLKKQSEHRASLDNQDAYLATLLLYRSDIILASP
jgi:hypothetical protein